VKKCIGKLDASVVPTLQCRGRGGGEYHHLRETLKSKVKGKRKKESYIKNLKGSAGLTKPSPLAFWRPQLAEGNAQFGGHGHREPAEVEQNGERR